MWVTNVGVDEEAVHLRVNVLHCNLETVEESRFRHLDFTREIVHLNFKKKINKLKTQSVP